jgi:molybdopterin adenylyltransferase
MPRPRHTAAEGKPLDRRGPRNPETNLDPRTSILDARTPYNQAVALEEHRKTAVTGVRCAVLTISDTRAVETDVSGRAIVELLEGARHVVAKRQILRDEPKDVHDAVLGQIGGVDAVITTGGTGITSRDSTYEAIASLLDKRLEGFGELFRVLSYQEIGSAAMMTRATAGVARGTAIFMLPGAENAVRLAMTKLILPELGHVIRELRR